MSAQSLLQSIVHFVSEHPSLWPALLLVVLLPLVLAVAGQPVDAARFARRRVRVLALFGVLGVALFAATALTYLHCASFWDIFESREASVAALLRRGGTVYPGPETQERYCAPYGPALYLILAGSQAVFGASVWATKLPSCVAALAALALFWQVARRQYASRAAAWALTGLEAALLMAFRQLPFWAKSDPLVLCASTAGLFAAFRPGWGWCAALGVCSGVATDLKPHALAYFLPSLVVAWQTGWRQRQYALWAAVTAAVALGPWVVMRAEFPVENYLGFLVLTAHEGVGAREILGFARWVGLLTALVFVFDRLTLHPHGLSPEERRLRRAYRAALGVAVVLVTVPACSVGAGQPHLIPLIPLFLLAAGDRFSATLRVRWRPAARPVWVAAAGAGALACVLVTLQTTARMERFHTGTDAAARACAADASRLLTKYAGRTVLTGSGGGGDMETLYQRHLAVFAGNPIGLDAAAVMDYQRGGAGAPDFERFAAEMRARQQRALVFLLPRGADPFSLTNLYDARDPAYLPEFRREFLAQFKRSEPSEFYDVYVPKADGL